MFYLLASHTSHSCAFTLVCLCSTSLYVSPPWDLESDVKSLLTDWLQRSIIDLFHPLSMEGLFFFQLQLSFSLVRQPFPRKALYPFLSKEMNTKSRINCCVPMTAFCPIKGPIGFLPCWSSPTSWNVDSHNILIIIQEIHECYLCLLYLLIDLW